MAKKARKSESKFVTVAHPNIKKQARCSERAFDEVWSARGWTIVADASATEQPPPDTNPKAPSGAKDAK